MGVSEVLRKAAMGGFPGAMGDVMDNIRVLMGLDADVAGREVMAAVADAIDEESDGSMALPRDVDGDVIRPDSVVRVRDHAGRWSGPEPVAAITQVGCYVCIGGCLTHFWGNDCQVHAPTVEEVLREFGDWYAHTEGGCDEDGVIASYAKRLRLAGEDR